MVKPLPTAIQAYFDIDRIKEEKWKKRGLIYHKKIDPSSKVLHQLESNRRYHSQICPNCVYVL